MPFPSVLSDSFKASRIVEHKHKYLVKFGLFLGSTDIGVAKLHDGRTVYTSWGRDLSEAEAVKFCEASGEEVAYFHLHDGTPYYEIIIPDRVMDGLKDFLIESNL